MFQSAHEDPQLSPGLGRAELQEAVVVMSSNAAAAERISTVR